MSRRAKTKFLKMSIAEFRQSALENNVRTACCYILRIVGIPHSITDAALIFDDSGEVAGRAVPADGWPDITGCLFGTGRLLAVETKRGKGGRLSPSQARCLESLRIAGAVVVVPHSVEDLARALIEAGIEHPALRRLHV